MSYKRGKQIAGSMMKLGNTVSGVASKSEKNPTQQHPGQSSTKPRNYNTPKPRKKQTDKGNYYYSYGGMN